MNSRWLAIKQLDQQLKEWRAVSQKYGKPRAGWIKTLRMALNMTGEQLAKRLGVTRFRINQLERAEVNNAVTLHSLKEAATALGCEFVYAIVPKSHATLESIIRNKAKQTATERLERVAHTMSLEAQSIDTILERKKEELTKALIENFNKKLWKANEMNSQILVEQIRKFISQIQENKIVDDYYITQLNDPVFLNYFKKALRRK